MPGPMQRPVLSVIVPCYNEEEAIGECHARLSAVLAGMQTAYEIVYVDDGSRDRTLAVLHAVRGATRRP